MASAKERLQQLQTALCERGVVDVKFCLSVDPATAPTEVSADVADFLEAALIKEQTADFKGLGDSMRSR